MARILFLIPIFGCFVLTSFIDASTVPGSVVSKENETGEFDQSYYTTSIAASVFLTLGNLFLAQMSNGVNLMNMNITDEYSSFFPQNSAIAKATNIPLNGLGLQNKRSGRCFDVPGASIAVVHSEIWDCDETTANQKFILDFTGESVQDGPDRSAPTFQLRAKHSNMCQGVYTRANTNNEAILQYNCYTWDDYQKWYLRWVPQNPSSDKYTNDHGFGYFQIVGVGSGKCVDVANGSTKNGVSLNIYDCGRLNSELQPTNQLWKFI